MAVFIAIILTACKGNASAVPTPRSNGDGINPLIGLDFNLTKIVLGPKDVSDLFQGTSYSINQAIASSESKGEIVTFPTQFLPHTAAFASGLSTRIEIFTNIDQAVKSYDTILSQQSGANLDVNQLGDYSRAFVRPALSPEGFDLGSTEYTVLFRERNAVATIILRTDRTVLPIRLREIAKLVVDRLQP